MRLTITITLLLGLSYLAFSSVFAAAGHSDGACLGQVWDQKTGPTTIWWKAVTTCNDHAAGELNHYVRLQYFDWGDHTWKDDVPYLAANVYNDDFLADSRYWEVDTYVGLFCWRVRGHHFIVEREKSGFAEAETYSWGRCY